MVRSATRLLLRHWPVMLALALAGFAARRGFLTLSVEASELHAIVGLLVFAMVPLSMLVALMLMMRVARSALPDPAPATEAESKPGVFQHFASVLVPFLAVYAAYDYFDDDRRSYVYEIWADENLNNGDVFTNLSAVDLQSRLPFDINAIMLAVAGVAFGLRMLLGWLAKSKNHALLGFSRGYLEATWLTLGAVTVSGLTGPAFDWIEQRRVIAWIGETTDAIVASLGPFSSIADWLVTFGTDMVKSADAVILVPIAWLTIGCVVYGQRMVSPSVSDPAAVEKARQRWDRLPGRAQTVLTPLRTDARDRFGPMVRGLRLLKHAGLPTMLLFCLAFVVAQSVPHWLWEVERWMIGPHDLGQFWMPLSGPLSTVNFAVGATLTICLVTAAVDHVLRVPVTEPDVAAQESAGDAQPGELGEAGAPADVHGDGLGSTGHDEQERRAVVG